MSRVGVVVVREIVRDGSDSYDPSSLSLSLEGVDDVIES